MVCGRMIVLVRELLSPKAPLFPASRYAWDLKSGRRSLSRVTVMVGDGVPPGMVEREKAMLRKLGKISQGVFGQGGGPIACY